MAATNNSNTVQVSDFLHVAQPQLANELTYTGSGIDVTFVVRYESESGSAQMGEELPSSAYTVSFEAKEGGTGSLDDSGKPVDAGDYIATITLTNGDTFLVSGTGGDSTTATVEFSVAPYMLQMNADAETYLTANYGKYSFANGTLSSDVGFDVAQLFDLTSAPADASSLKPSISIEDPSSGTITPSGAGKLPVGTYQITDITFNGNIRHNYRVNMTGSTYVFVNEKDIDLEITINETLPQYYDGKSLTPTVTADHAAAIESGDVSELALKIAVDSAEVDAILNAGTYTFDAELIGADADNYILIPTFKTASGDEIASGEWTVEPYNLRLSWSFDSQNPLEYGDEISNDLIADTEISTASAIPYNGGEFTGFIDFRVTGATYNNGTDYAPGVAVGTSVTFVVEAILPEIEGFIESNYNVILSSDSTSRLVEQRTLEIDYENVVNYMAPLTYGEELSNALLAERFNESYTYYVSNIYNGESVSFAVTWCEEVGFYGSKEPVGNFADIVPNTPYYGRVQVAYGVDNYRLPDDANDTYFEFMVWPKELTVTGVTWEAGFDGVFDGKAHSVVVESDLIEGDVYDFVIDITDEGGLPVDSVTDAGTYTVTVGADEDNLYYDLGLSDAGNVFTLTIAPYDLANATVTIAESDLVYTGSAITVTPSVKGGENDFTSMLTAVVNGGEAVVNAGDYTITASDTNNSGNFTGEATGTFEVAKKQLKLESLTLSSSTYTGEEITDTGYKFAADYEPAGKEKPELVIALQGGGSVKNAGEYTFNVSLATDNDVNKNYVMADGAGTITATVSPASVTVTAGKNAELGALYGVSATADTSRFYESDFITFDPAKPDGTFKLEEALTFTVTNNETQEDVQEAEGAYTLAPGTYTVTYTIENVENANYTLTASDPLTTTLTVKEGALKLTITGWNNTSPTYDGTAQLPTPVFAGSAEIGEKIEEGALVFTVTAKEGSSLTGSDAVNAGSYTVTVSIAAGFEQKYELAEGSQNSTDFTIKKLEVVLKWEAKDDLVYNGKEHTATATVDNKVVDDDVRVIVGLVSGNNNVNVGEFFYEATELTGNDAGNYSLPAEKRQAFEVTPAQKEITWNFVEHATIVYGDSVEDVKKLVNIAALNGTIPGVADPLTFTVSVGDYSATTNAGTEVTFDVSYTLPAGATAANYEITVSAANGNTLTVGKATLTLTIADSASLTKVYDGEAVTLASLLTADNVSVAGMKNGEDAFTPGILAISGTDEMTNADTYNGSITVIGDNYTAEPLEITYTITPQPIGVAWTDTAFEYDGAAHKPTATATGLVGGDSLTLTVTGEQTNADSYTATVAAFEQGNYKLEQDATVEFTIARKSVSVAWENTEFTYDGTAHKPTATVGEAQGLVKGDDLQITVNGEQTNAGDDYTATAEITGGEDMGNYVLDESSVSTTFTIAPKPITISFTANDSANTINFDVAGSVTVGAWTIDGAGKATLVLSDGTTANTLTVEASEALPTTEENVPALLLLLDSTLYEGTPYGTKVEGGSLTVISADTNYVFEVAQAITLNITPAIIVDLKDGVQTKLGLTDVLNTGYNAKYFKDNYFKVTGKDGETVTGGTLEVTITPPEGVELPEGVIKHAGTYTVTAVYTPAGAQEGAELPTFSFDFIVTPVEVTSVTYSGEPLVYGDLSASGDIAVTIKYADETEVNVTAQYTSENVSTGNRLNAGDTQVTVNYTGDNRDYAAVTDHVITLTVEKKAITATINYGEQSGTALTLTYNGSGYTIGAELNGVLSGDGVSAEVLKSFIDVAASPYEVEITLGGIDSDNYKIEGEYTVTITPADVTYEWSFAENAAITYGDSVEDVTALAVMPDGALLGVEDKVTFQVSVGDYSATTKAGTEVTFTVNAKLPESAKADNYNIIITAVDGNTLNVGKATLTLTIADTASLTKVYDGEAVTLASLLTADNVSVAGMKNGEDAFTLGILAISGTDEMTNAGAYNGSVSVIENCNYTAEAIVITYTVTPKSIGVAWTDTEFTYDGTAHKPTATATGLVEGDSLTLTYRNRYGSCGRRQPHSHRDGRTDGRQCGRGDLHRHR